MPSQEPTPPGRPAVRRAVTLPGTAGPPDPAALTPLGTGSAETGATDPVGAAGTVGAAGAVSAEAEAAAAEQPKVSLDESAPAGESAESVTPDAAGTTAASAVGAPDVPQAQEVPPAAADGHAGGHGSADAMASAAGDHSPGAGTEVGEEGDEPPSGRPTKALLAAAGIAGALLISLPFLAFGADDDGRETQAASEPTSGMTVPKIEETGPGTYTAKSPTPTTLTESPTPTPTKESESPSPETKPEPEPETETKPEPSSEHPKAKKTLSVSRPYLLAPEQYKNFQIKNMTTNRCADLPGSGKDRLGGAILQHDCLDNWKADNQVWDFVLAQKGKGPDGRNLVVIKNTKSGLCMDLPEKGSQPIRTPLRQNTCNLTLQDNQLWWIEERDNAEYWIHNYASDQRCLEVWGEKPNFSGNDARVGIYTCSPTDDHEWRMTTKS
ncbi:RICIN domain-containing protein [Streptomyces sp. NPDC054940]